MATPEENLAAALARAEKARSEGKLDRAATWEASADRYRKIIEAKEKIATAATNVAEIKERISNIGKSSGEITSGPNKGWYQHVTSRPSAACPSGHERVRITFMDGVETNVESLGCHGGERSGNPEREVGTPPTVERTVSPTPQSPPPPPPPPPPVKTAPIDTILFDDSSMSIEIMTDLIFEDIGGQEIISIVRNDTVNGQNIIYQPIKNLSLINQQYNPNNVLALQGTSDKYFENFMIKLSNKIPYEGNGPDGQNVYIDEDTLDIVLDLINLEQDEQAEFQFRIDGTIYEAEL
jgi:hypothetical protein